MIIHWVDAENGDDSTGTGSREAPYATIDKALTLFSSGDQIRLLPGTYIPTDAIVISGKDGSIFAEDPYSVYIQPAKTTVHQACVAILAANRFTIQGINIIQAADSSGNLIGLYAEDVDNFICHTCAISDFMVPSGNGVGIFASGLLGRVEHCTVSNFTCGGETTYGIKTKGIVPVKCSVSLVSGAGYCYPIDMDGLSDA